MKIILAVCLALMFSYAPVSQAEDCLNFSKSKVFPTANIVTLRLVK